MKSFLLIGAGTFGMHIAKKLNSFGIEILAVDSNEENINEILPYVTSAQIGDATNKQFLDTLGVNDFDVCIVTVGDNLQDSLEITALLSEAKCSMIVARASNDVHAKLLDKCGANEVIYPEKQVAEWAAVKYCSEHIFDYMHLSDNVGIYEVDVPDDWAGKTLGKLDIRNKHGLNVIGTKDSNENFNVALSSDTILYPNERLLVLGTEHSIKKCFKI